MADIKPPSAIRPPRRAKTLEAPPEAVEIKGNLSTTGNKTFADLNFKVAPQIAKDFKALAGVLDVKHAELFRRMMAHYLESYGSLEEHMKRMLESRD